MLCWLYHREVWLPLVYQCLNQNHMFTCSASCFIAIPSNHHWRASCCKHAKDWGQALWFKSDSLQDHRSLQSLTRWKNTGITCCKLSASAVHDMNYRESSASTLLWNLCLDTLPEEVLGNFDDFFEAQNCVSECTRGSLWCLLYSDWRGQFTFKDVEMAPPSGVVGQTHPA